VCEENKKKRRRAAMAAALLPLQQLCVRAGSRVEWM